MLCSYQKSFLDLSVSIYLKTFLLFMKRYCNSLVAGFAAILKLSYRKPEQYLLQSIQFLQKCLFCFNQISFNVHAVSIYFKTFLLAVKPCSKYLVARIDCLGEIQSKIFFNILYFCRNASCIFIKDQFFCNFNLVGE